MSTLPNKSDSVPPPPRPIRFVHNQGQPPSKRRRINAACLTCRKRKTRCAGERPLCSTCTKNGHRCLGYPEDTKREDGEKLDVVVKPDEVDRDGELYEQYDDQDMQGRSAKQTTAMSDTSYIPQVPADANVSHTEPTLEAKPDQDSLTATHNAQPSKSLARDLPSSPTAVQTSENNRVPYFRYFGPTAIVPGFKQMVVSVRDRRRSTAGSVSGTSPLSTQSGPHGSSSIADSEAIAEDLPVYDPNDAAPVHPLIMSLVKTFFLQMGSSFPFLKQARFLRMVKEKRVESILVDSVCALAARFSDHSSLTGGSDKMPRTERGNAFAQRARRATVDTFPCPTVGAVQACLLMAYEGFGASQDSALWMYLGLAIRMAVDLGLQKEVGVQYHGDKDPIYTRNWSRQPGEEESPEVKVDGSSPADPNEQKEVVQERTDTFWAVFILDRVISSGTGRPVTFRDDDLELSFPEPSIDPSTQWPNPSPIFLQIIYLYGQVSDMLNKICNAQDLTRERWDTLAEMEYGLTRMYKSWDWRLQFNVSNFKAYLGAGQGTTFILLHFWFHALFIILHQPTLLTPFAELRSELQLLPDSRELSMSSAKTICDILSFADLIDPKSFIGNPFTSQPIYISACAFLMESSANASETPPRVNPPPAPKPQNIPQPKSRDMKSSRHSLLASAANQNYQRCYNSLQQIQMYWGGVTYILTALDQKAKGIWDCETYTTEEYESTKLHRRGSNGNIPNAFPRLDSQSSPKMTGPPIAWSLAGTANSPSSSLTLMYQNLDAAVSSGAQQLHGAPRTASTPPGNMVYDPIRSSLPESTSMMAPAYPQSFTSSARQPSRPSMGRRHSNLSAASRTMPKLDRLPENGDGADMYMASRYTPTHHGYDAYSASPPLLDNGAVNPPTTMPGTNMYYSPNSAALQMSWTAMGNMDAITFDSQDIDIGALGLQQPDLMGSWLDYIPNDVLGLFDNTDMGPE